MPLNIYACRKFRCTKKLPKKWPNYSKMLEIYCSYSLDAWKKRCSRFHYYHHFPALTTTKQPVPSVTSVALGTTVASAKASSIKRPPVSATPPSPQPPTSVVSSAASRTSSFAAALRNLAKNATSVANEPPNVASVASVVPEPPALLDVRRVSNWVTRSDLLSVCGTFQLLNSEIQTFCGNCHVWSERRKKSKYS